MAIIRIKRSTGTTAPGDNALKNAELAYTMGTGTYGNKGGRLFIGQDSNGSGYADSASIVGGNLKVGGGLAPQPITSCTV